MGSGEVHFLAWKLPKTGQGLRENSLIISSLDHACGFCYGCQKNLNSLYDYDAKAARRRPHPVFSATEENYSVRPGLDQRLPRETRSRNLLNIMKDQQTAEEQYAQRFN